MKKVVAAFLCSVIPAAVTASLALPDGCRLLEKRALVIITRDRTDDCGLMTDNSRCYPASLDYKRITIGDKASTVSLLTKNHRRNSFLNGRANNFFDPFGGDVQRREATIVTGAVAPDAAVRERPVVDRKFLLLATTALATTVADTATTLALINTGRYREGNPITAKLAQRSPAGFVAAHLGITGGLVYGAYELKKGKVGWWWVPLAALIATQARITASSLARK